MSLYSQTVDITSPEGTMDAKLASTDTRAYAALAIAIIAIGAQLIMVVFMVKLWRNARPSHRSADPERGLELDNVPRAAPADTRPRGLPGSPIEYPVAPTPAQSHGRPVAAYKAYTPTERHGGEADAYFYPPAPARKPTYTADSGLGTQTHGADYREQRREARHESDGHRTNTNDADYGRRGNRFAHGT
ncbi:hypothetical protein INS49_005419 [Diaporthe citri]|uniref:uncharacterized protein n=1 Tax=Diaporthe citri TaxID=83186 RepID=UPI001C81AD67|nr:uncharacterized protein INS49_005419 [Diaporthe citri]KAG6353710.1 hypothetical protein INS49_005419 [Diaporthe citri]